MPFCICNYTCVITPHTRMIISCAIAIYHVSLVPGFWSGAHALLHTAKPSMRFQLDGALVTENDIFEVVVQVLSSIPQPLLLVSLQLAGSTSYRDESSPASYGRTALSAQKAGSRYQLGVSGVPSLWFHCPCTFAPRSAP